MPERNPKMDISFILCGPEMGPGQVGRDVIRGNEDHDTRVHANVSDANALAENPVVVLRERVCAHGEGIDERVVEDVVMWAKPNMTMDEMRAAVFDSDPRSLRSMFQKPKGYVPGLGIPCTNEDIETCPPLQHSGSPYCCIPLPCDEGDKSTNEDFKESRDVFEPNRARGSRGLGHEADHAEHEAKSRETTGSKSDPAPRGPPAAAASELWMAC